MQYKAGNDVSKLIKLYEKYRQHLDEQYERKAQRPDLLQKKLGITERVLALLTDSSQTSSNKIRAVRDFLSETPKSYGFGIGNNEETLRQTRGNSFFSGSFFTRGNSIMNSTTSITNQYSAKKVKPAEEKEHYQLLNLGRDS